ncbi:hypothetical protein [Natranaerobius thermophilus]|uniref:Lipoprotein n=1 Tax=Natranaerobius thermophilus (strain ATCC BAA-1301 / DSM 18059 / JW/NM-WN-LF) TaxID=457570 RepID=B2A198_NATTJ|nr:hypothetical protein [Natranaerobius thermophilus]ACB86036.1 hypothetical protein Nther_2473 [Natranaerobius thermophilus JW/NM-WN-LF]
MFKKGFTLILVLLLGVMVFSGCGESQPTEEEAGHSDNGVTFEIIDRSIDEVVDYHHDDHWHSGLPEIPLNDNISLGANIIDENEEEIELDGEHHALGIDFADDANEDIVSLDEHGDHVHIIGEKEGETEVIFQLLHDGEVEHETVPIPAEVAK